MTTTGYSYYRDVFHGEFVQQLYGNNKEINIFDI